MIPVGFSMCSRYLAFVARTSPDQWSPGWFECHSGATVVMRQLSIDSSWGDCMVWCGQAPQLLCRVKAKPPRSTGCPATHLAIIDVVHRTVRTVVLNGIAQSLLASPNGKYVLARCAPFGTQAIETLVTQPQSCALLDTSPDNEPIRLDNNGRQQELSGYSIDNLEWVWHACEGATLVTSVRDAAGARIVTIAEPFTGAAVELARTSYPCLRYCWTTEGLLVTWEYDRVDRTLMINLSGPDRLTRTNVWTGRLLPDDGVALRWSQVGRVAEDEIVPLWEPSPTKGLIAQCGSSLFVSGVRNQDGCPHSYIDALDILSRARRTLFESANGRRDRIVGLLDRVGHAFCAITESPEDPPHAVVYQAGAADVHLRCKSAPRRQLPPPATRHVVRYHGYDRNTLTGDLYVPRRPGPQPWPCVVWIYPELKGFKDIQDRILPNQHLSMWSVSGDVSPMLLLHYGYAVMHYPTFPLKPDATHPDAIIHQLCDVATNLVNDLVCFGIDPQRIMIGGHCLGAYAAVLLLIHTRLFCAGIACGGFYNLTNQPVGLLLTARQALWNAPQAYLTGSPLLAAHKIQAPLLLIHGEQDRTLWVDAAFESRRLEAALAATGGKVRRVSLSAEGHAYCARESIATVLTEMLQWCDRHLSKTSLEM